MMRPAHASSIAFLISIFSFLLAPAAPGPSSHHVSLEARFDKVGDNFFIPVRGKTDLPDGAIVSVGAYYLKPASEIFIRPDLPSPPPDAVHLDSTDVAVKGGGIEARLWFTKRVPYPGTYRIRAAVNWPDQPAFFRGEKPDERDPLEWLLDFPRGTADDLVFEREEIRRGVKADLLQLADAQRELAGRFREALRDPKAADGWADWAKARRAPLGPLAARNEERLEVGVFWTETQGKYRVKDLMERIESLAQGYAASLAAPPRPADVPPSLAQQEKDFKAIFDGAMGLLGYLKPVDPALVREHLEPIAADFALVEKAAAALAGDPPGLSAQGVEELHARALDHLNTGLGALLPDAPEQAVEPATAYTEALTGWFDDAAGIAAGRRKADDAFRRKLDEARTQLRRLREMMGPQKD